MTSENRQKGTLSTSDCQRRVYECHGCSTIYVLITFNPLRNSENMKAMTARLGGQIVRLKMSPLRSTSWPDDVTWRNNYAIISERRPSWISGFFQNLKTPSEIGSKVIKTNKSIIKWSKDKKIVDEILKKHSCQNMVAMETSSHVDFCGSYQIVARQLLETFSKFGSVCFNIRKVINVKSRRGQYSLRPPGLNSVKGQGYFW